MVTELNFDPWKSKARPWEIFDENYRSILQEKILRNYWNEEIAYATMSEFRERINSQLFIDMPYYNRLYKSTLLKFDPFINFVLNQDDTGQSGKISATTQDKKVDTTGNTSGNTSGSSTEDGTSTTTTTYDQDRDFAQTTETVATSDRIHSDTPEGVLNFRPVDYASDVTNEDGKQDVATDGTEHITGNTNTRGTTGKVGETSGETSGEYSSTVIDMITGTLDERLDTFNYRRSSGINRMTFSKALTEYRETFLNIDRQIVDSLWKHFNTVIIL